MARQELRWAADLGCIGKIRSLALKSDLGAHGLSGKLAEGELNFSRQVTRRLARQDAQDGIPVSEALTQDQWSEREQQVTERAERVRTGLATWISTSSATVRNFIHDCTPGEISPDPVCEAIRAEEADIRHYEVDDASEAERYHEDSVVELNQFREQHGERLGKRTPDIKKTVEQAIAILVFVMILEGVFNALLFKDAQASGLLGGLMVAFGVSAVNVTLGVVTGFFGLRYLNHPDRFMKAIGGGVAMLGLATGLLINAFVAHYRDGVEAGLHAAEASGSLAGFSMFQIAPGDVMARLGANPVGLDSLVAFGLLFIGLCVFAISVYEGYERLSDRYPGYGRVWRKERMAYERRQAVRHGVRDDLSDYFTTCRAWFETQQSRHLQAKREIEKAMNLLETRRDQAVAIAQRAGEQERSHKVTYRQAHRRERNTVRDTLGDQAEVPAYFDEILTPNLPPFDFSKERAQADAAIKAIDQNMVALNITRQWLEQHVQEVQHGLSTIQTRVGEEIAKARGAREAREQAQKAKSA